MIDRVSLLIISIGFVLMLSAISFVAYQAVQLGHIHERISEQHALFLANQAMLLRDHDRLMHEHDAAARDHRAILQRLGH